MIRYKLANTRVNITKKLNPRDRARKQVLDKIFAKSLEICALAPREVVADEVIRIKSPKRGGGRDTEGRTLAGPVGSKLHGTKAAGDSRTPGRWRDHRSAWSLGKVLERGCPGRAGDVHFFHPILQKVIFTLAERLEYG